MVLNLNINTSRSPLSFFLHHLDQTTAATNLQTIVLLKYLKLYPTFRQDVLIRDQWSVDRHWRGSRLVPWHDTSISNFTMEQFEFLRQLSLNPANTVIGLVRNVKSVEAKAKAEINRSNVHIVHGDLDSYEVLKVSLASYPQDILLVDLEKKASEATAEITGGSLDYLIANGARLPEGSSYVGFGEL